MAADYLKYASGNSASTTASSGISNSDTSAPLTSDTAFSAKSGEGMVIISEGENVEEFAYATGKSGGALTIPLANRGLEGGSAQTHASGATVKGIITAGMWNNVIDALTNLVSKVTGALDTTKVVDLTTAQTLTTKRITKRVTAITSNANPTVNTDNCDVVDITAQAEAIASMTTNLTGTPTNFQGLIVRIKDNGTARAITWGASFEARGTALPTTTVISKVLTVGFIYDTTTSKWGCIASAQEA
jgi:hypothetical protein